MKKNGRNLVIAILCLVVLVMTIGYAVFSSSLNISGTSNITNEWKIIITNIVQKEIGGSASEKSVPTFDSLNANFEVGFNKPGDYVTYTVTVANQGTLNAALDSIKINLEKTDIVSFKVDGIASGDKLNVNESKTFDITFKFNDAITSQPSKTSFEVSMKLNYLQDGSKTNFSDADSPSKDTLAINGIDLTPNETTIDVSVDASNAVKYYYSLDNDKYFETLENSYVFSDLEMLKDYTIWVKAEDSDGNVVISSKDVTTVDKTKPTIKIREKEVIKGNNGYDLGVILTNLITDNGNISSVKYCTGTDDKCTPSKEVVVTNGKFDYAFRANKEPRVLCVEATDSANNSSTKCSSSYLVDNEDPTLDKLRVTPDDNTMLVEVTAADNISGLYKYYFSKDSGRTYVESNNPNYTFTELAEGDYMVMAYVEDKAGNISEKVSYTTSVKYEDICNRNDINGLGDCLLALEAGKEDVASAKSTIEAKGTPDFSRPAPVFTYEMVRSSSLSTVSVTNPKIYVGTGYTFDSKAGTYSLRDYSLVDPTSVDYESGDYYVLSNVSTNNSQRAMYKVTGVTTETDENGQITYTLAKYNYNRTVASYDISEVGMYSSRDEDGVTYYYRGISSNNYVSFAGNLWRIVRVDSAGNVRVVLNNNVETKAKYSNAYVGNELATVDDAIEMLDYRNSDIRKTVEAWYETNIGSHADSKNVVNSKFCVNMSYQGPITTPYGKTVYYFKPYVDVGIDVHNFNADFSCSSENTFTSSVGLLSAVEVMAAGGYWQEINNKYYLYNKDLPADTPRTSWTLSASYYSISEKQAGVITFNQDREGSLFDYESNGNLSYKYGYRPVITLDGTVKATGKGTKEDPFVLVND